MKRTVQRVVDQFYLNLSKGAQFCSFSFKLFVHRFPSKFSTKTGGFSTSYRWWSSFELKQTIQPYNAIYSFLPSGFLRTNYTAINDLNLYEKLKLQQGIKACIESEKLQENPNVCNENTQRSKKQCIYSMQNYSTFVFQELIRTEHIRTFLNLKSLRNLTENSNL